MGGDGLSGTVDERRPLRSFATHRPRRRSSGSLDGCEGDPRSRRLTVRPDGFGEQRRVPVPECSCDCRWRVTNARELVDNDLDERWTLHRRLIRFAALTPALLPPLNHCASVHCFAVDAEIEGAPYQRLERDTPALLECTESWPGEPGWALGEERPRREQEGTRKPVCNVFRADDALSETHSQRVARRSASSGTDTRAKAIAFNPGVTEPPSSNAHEQRVASRRRGRQEVEERLERRPSWVLHRGRELGIAVALSVCVTRYDVPNDLWRALVAQRVQYVDRQGAEAKCGDEQ